MKIFQPFFKLFCLLAPVLIVQLSFAQTTVTITANTTPGVFSTGAVNSTGVKSDGNLTTLSTSTGNNRGWAVFDLSSIPAGSVINSANVLFTTYSSTSSTAANSVRGFVGNPNTLAGVTLYNNINTGVLFNSSSWTASALQTKAVSAAGLTFLQSNFGGTVVVGFVRGSTNTYNVYGYPGTAAQRPKLEITYTVLIQCSGTPNAGSVTGPTNACAGQNISLSLTGQSQGGGLSFQWKSRPTGSGLPFTNISGATGINYSGTVTTTTDFICQTHCANSGQSNATPIHTVILPAAPTGISDTVCMGNTLTLQALTDTNNYTYKWYGTLTSGSSLHTGDTFAYPNLIADTFFYLTYTKNGCESDRIAVPGIIGPPPVVNVGNDTTYCANAVFKLNAGNQGAEYLWNTGAKTQSIEAPVISGQYWVAVNKYCVVTDTINITIDPLPHVNGISYVRSGNVYSFSPAGDIYVDSYRWLFGDGASDTGRVVSHTYADGNMRTVRLITTNHCASDTFSLITPTEIKGPEENANEIKVYPNPASDYVEVSIDTKEVLNISVYNSIGIRVLTNRNVEKTGNCKINISSLQSGTYFIRAESVDKVDVVQFRILR